MKTEIYWKAVETNDSRFNGVFFTGVKTTKIYCKPSCPAKLPKRENVKFFASIKTAESEGFRACLRCKPQTEKADPQTKIVIRACEILESEEQATLEHLGSELNVSPTHLQKTFKQIIGVSPKKYSEMKRLEKFKGELKNGSEVVDAMFEAGYGSSSRLYENVSDKLGMTPAVYKKGGKDMEIDFTIVECDLGKMLVARTEKGLCSLTFSDDENELIEILNKEFPKAKIRQSDTKLKDFVKAILGNLQGTNKTLDLPLDLQATAFQMRVWDALQKIPYGETVSYQEVAEKIGNKKAVRAVATACASNRVAIVIPCHRVVRSDGGLSGYRWGVERKKKILEKEKSGK
jgi:AraC family transcriptional regulator of adaptative response/methylated-DNA-[protein]-cysteine methyltransferase